MPIFDDQTRSSLLDSIEANRLLLLCGAGLSMPAPSNLMSAARVAEACFEKRLPLEALPEQLKYDVDALAAHFHQSGRLEDVFIDTLVPWDDLVGEPNDGHAAVADLLICRGIAGALSANFDPLIEHWSIAHKMALRGALNGAQAQEYANHTSPLLKFHGCSTLARRKTLWTHSQLNDDGIQPTIQSCTDWIKLHITGKDLLVVGFWTDWEYLNEALESVIGVEGLHSVTVIDLQNEDALRTKAPGMWAKLSAVHPFALLTGDAAGALDELRTHFSKVWAKKFFRLGKPLLDEMGASYPAGIEDEGLSGTDLYKFRQDGEGASYSRAAKRREPAADARQAAFMHLLLKNAGAQRQGVWYALNDETIRVVQGAGESIATVRERHIEAPASPKPSITICAGALDVSAPANIVTSGNGNSIVRPSAEVQSTWLTIEQARARIPL